MDQRSFSRRTFLAGVSTIPLLLMLPSGVLAAARFRISSLRHWPEPERSRFVLDLDGEAPFFSMQLDDSNRVRIRIENAELLRSLDQAILKDPLVSRVQARQLESSVEIDITLKRKCEFNSFALPPNGTGRGHRIVVDVSAKLSQTEAQEIHSREAKRVEAVRRSGDRVIAIDAGHGGEDPGTVWGKALKEKVVALEVCELLAAEIDKQPGLRAVLTRSGDYFIPLAKRQAIAKRYDADIFVSIHVNAARSRRARGAEVFFLSLQGAVDKAAKELIDRENAADLVGGVAQQKVKEPIVDILMGMKRDQTIKESERLADLLLHSLQRVPGGKIRSVKQGPLAVLRSIEKPSVLVELGFFTNPSDRKLLASATAHRAYAKNLSHGIRGYFA